MVTAKSALAADKVYQIQIPDSWMKPLEMPLVPPVEDNKPEHIIRHFLRDPHDKTHIEITIIVGANETEKAYWKGKQDARMEAFNKVYGKWAWKVKPKHLRTKPFMLFVDDGHKLFGHYPLVRNNPPVFAEWWTDEMEFRIQYTGSKWILISGDFDGWKVMPPPEVFVPGPIHDDVPPPPPIR